MKQSHGESKEFQCEICSKAFALRHFLKAHIRNCHNTVKCEKCSKEVNVGTLNAHMRRHLNDRPHKCHICQKKFSNKFHMKEHVLRHSDPYPFKCDKCPKKFGCAHSLNTHKRQNHPEVKFLVEKF